MRSFFALLLAASTLTAAGLAAAEELPSHKLPPPFDGEQWNRAEETARQGLEKLLQSFDQLLQAVPQYGAPHVDDHGNIVIPRKQPRQAPPGLPDRDNPVIRT